MNGMDDLNDRFRALDRLDVPNMWHEATVRAADPDEIARRSLPDLDSGAMRYAVPIALVAAAVFAVALLGINVLFTGVGGVGGPTASSPVASKTPSPTATPLDPSDLDAGFIGLPPSGATPSDPSRTELVEVFIQPGAPYTGATFLYADGRMIWNRYYGAANSSSTGWLEQRLTIDGIELVRALADSRP